VLSFYSNGTCQGTDSIDFLRKSCGPSIGHHNIFLSWFSQRAGVYVLLGKPATWKIIAPPCLRVPPWVGALTWPQGASHLQEQPNHWLRNFFRSWLTPAANLDYQQRAPIKALPSIPLPGLETLIKIHKWKEITPWGKKSNIFIVCSILYSCIIHYL
jgi:hypothetical protein